MLALLTRQEVEISRHQRFVERVTLVLGRPRSIYVIVAATAAWIAYNLWAPLASRPAPDPPPFQWLQGVIGLMALLMTVMVLTTQNRQGRHAEQRARLDLQVNLLAEQKVAKLIALVEELRRDLPNVRDRQDPLAEAMATAVNPEAVIAALDTTSDPQAPTKDDESPRREEGEDNA